MEIMYLKYVYFRVAKVWKNQTISDMKLNIANDFQQDCQYFPVFISNIYLKNSSIQMNKYYNNNKNFGRIAIYSRVKLLKKYKNKKIVQFLWQLYSIVIRYRRFRQISSFLVRRASLQNFRSISRRLRYDLQTSWQTSYTLFGVHRWESNL